MSERKIIYQYNSNSLITNKIYSKDKANEIIKSLPIRYIGEKWFYSNDVINPNLFISNKSGIYNNQTNNLFYTTEDKNKKGFFYLTEKSKYTRQSISHSWHLYFYGFLTI